MHPDGAGFFDCIESIRERLKKNITCDITCSYWALARRRRGFGKRKFSEPTFNFSRFLISKVFKHNVGNACAFCYKEYAHPHEVAYQGQAGSMFQH